MLRMLWSHCRNINVVATETLIKYSVPIYSEKGTIGKVKSIMVKDNEIEIEFHIKDTPTPDNDVKNKFLNLD
jgi:hypothetical protein